MKRTKPICLTTMIKKMNSTNTNYGRYVNWREFAEIERNAEKSKPKRLKFKEEERWIMKRYCLKTRSWVQMQLTTSTKLSMCSCRSIIIKELSTKIHKIQYLKGTIIYRLHFRCKISRCYQKYCKEERAISERRVKANISTWLLKIRQISTHSSELMKAY